MHGDRFRVTVAACGFASLLADWRGIILPKSWIDRENLSEGDRMFVTTTFTIDGYEIVNYLGVVRGLVVRSPTIAQGILGGLKSIVGGQIGAYTEMCEQTRQTAYDLLLQHAAQLGANAIVGMRYDASEIGGNRTSATEVLCYGTAVVVRPITRNS
jgi:uncharacterized protein YbjQ (UPF0145 family)